MADSDKIEVIKDNSIQQTDNRERGTPKHFGSGNKKSEPMIKSQGSKPINEIDEKSVITKLEEDLISVPDNTDNETESAHSDTSDDSDDNDESGGMVSISSSEGQYMLVSVVVLVSIIVILIITIIFILYKNYQFTHSKATDSDTLESSYPLYSARTLDSSHQVYSNSVQATPYKQQSGYNSSVTSFQGHYPGHTHSLGQSLGHGSRASESHYSNSNYYATTDLIQWHNRKYLGGGRAVPGPVDLWEPSCDK